MLTNNCVLLEQKTGNRRLHPYDENYYYSAKLLFFHKMKMYNSLMLQKQHTQKLL